MWSGRVAGESNHFTVKHSKCSIHEAVGTCCSKPKVHQRDDPSHCVVAEREKKLLLCDTDPYLSLVLSQQDTLILYVDWNEGIWCIILISSTAYIVHVEIKPVFWWNLKILNRNKSLHLYYLPISMHACPEWNSILSQRGLGKWHYMYAYANV